MKSYRDNVVVLNINGGSRWCRALRKKTMSQVEGIYTVCGEYVTGLMEFHRPGISIVTCSRCRAIERGARDTGSNRVASASRPD